MSNPTAEDPEHCEFCGCELSSEPLVIFHAPLRPPWWQRVWPVPAIRRWRGKRAMRGWTEVGATTEGTAYVPEES